MAASAQTLSRLKEKYPEYKDIPDAQLSVALIAKYPEYDEVATTPKASPTAQQDAFEKQFMAAGVQTPEEQAFGALTAGPRAGIGLAKGIGEIALKGVQGVGTEYGKFSANPSILDAIKNAAANTAQTSLEIVPRTAYDIAQGLAGAFQSPQAATSTLRSLNAISNPIAAAIQAFANPQTAPTSAQAQQAFQDELFNQAYAKQGEQGVAEFAQQQLGLPSGTANVDIARGAPLILGAEALPGAIVNLAKTAPEILKQIVRSGATAATTPFGALPRATRAVEPFLSGTKLAEAEVGADAAIARQAALDRALQKAKIEEDFATQQGLQGVAEARGTAATKGREALTAGRELRTAQGTIQPEIVAAQASIEEAAQFPLVILGSTAEAPAAFGRNAINAIEGPMKASAIAFDDAYTAVKKSLPAKQQSLEAKPLYDAAREAKGELSQGFEAYNKGEIKRILDEATKITPGESMITPTLQKLFDNGTPATKAAMTQQYPEFAQPVKGTIPKYTWSELQSRFRQLNQGINQALKYGNTNDARILGDLKRGLSQSMENYASKSGRDTLDLFNKANADYAAHQDKFGLNRIQTLFKDDVLQNPELVARDLIAFDNPSQVNAIKSIVSTEEFVPVQAQFSQKFFSPTPDVPFDPSHFVKQFSKPGARQTVEAVFGEQGLSDFTRIYESSKSFAKISDLQKTLDTLASQSETATKSFSKAKGAATDAQKALAEKNALKAQVQPIKDATTRADMADVNSKLNAALTELDRVRNYRDLKDWATRASGLNILEAATTSPAWEQLARYSALHLDKYQPVEE